jgi:hypothetical protein
VAHHPGLREREGGEDADHVEVDERVDVGAERDDQPGRDSGEHDDPVRIREPVAEVHELARQEPVPGEQGGEPREALVGGVRRQDEDREREGLDEVVRDRAR